MKGDRLGAALGTTGLAVHQASKSALDPRGLLNPGCMGLTPGGPATSNKTGQHS